MEKDKETEEKKLRDLTTEKDAKGGVSADPSSERPEPHFTVPPIPSGDPTLARNTNTGQKRTLPLD